MATPATVSARDELLDRRQRLEAALRSVADPEPLRCLLREVDATLERIEQGTFGLCSVCHEAIEADRLAVDPLLRNCLDHLTPHEQRALEHDLDLSARVQTALLPDRHLQRGGCEVAYHYEPLGPVSGDYCDVQSTANGDVLVLLGDVAGKGVAASLLMAHLHATFRSLMDVVLGLAEMVGRANRLFCESTRGRGDYATLACARIASDGAVEVLNAGHCPPLHIGPARVTSLPSDGLPLGIFCNSPYATTRIRLALGDTLLFYTDGVSEARNRQDVEFGEERLVQAAATRRTAPVVELVRGCLDDLTVFRDGMARQDDVTLLAVRWRS